MTMMILYQTNYFPNVQMPLLEIKSLINGRAYEREVEVWKWYKWEKIEW